MNAQLRAHPKAQVDARRHELEADRMPPDKLAIRERKRAWRAKQKAAA